MDACKDSIKTALAMGPDTMLTAWVADLVVARGFFPKIWGHMRRGHGAVFVLPPRSAAEPMRAALNQMNRALEPYELFSLCFRFLHPLWVACEFENRRFTCLPFTMLWSSPQGIVARSFSLTPVVFEPTEKMLEGRGMIDGDIPSLCRNPYWCVDWTDAPVIGVEPLFCYYAPFVNKLPNPKNILKDSSPPSIYRLRTWARMALHPTQRPFLKRKLYYPDRKWAKISFWRSLKCFIVSRLIA
jgi:hypothetical protein